MQVNKFDKYYLVLRFILVIEIEFSLILVKEI